MQKSISEETTLKQKTTPAATAVSYEQETKARICMGSEQRTGKMLPGLKSLNFCCNISMEGQNLA